jgi:uncharacterized protein (DUF2252 family)
MSILSERLINFNKGLLTDMVQLKYEAMTENTFRLYRGTCHLFYEDLANAHPLPLSPLYRAALHQASAAEFPDGRLCR